MTEKFLQIQLVGKKNEQLCQKIENMLTFTLKFFMVYAIIISIKIVWR